MADPIRIPIEVDKSQVQAADDALGELNKTTDKAIAESEEYSESNAALSDQLKSVSNNFTIAGKGLGDLTSGLKGAATASGGAAKGFKLVSLAMKAIPIVALITALGSLVAFFTKTERGAQKLRVATAFLEGAFGAVLDKVIAFGEAIVNAFENPQKALDDLKKQFNIIFTEFIPNAVNNVLQGFGKLGQAIAALFKGDFKEALDIAKEGGIQLLDGLTDLNPATAIIKSIAAEAKVLSKELVEDAFAAAELEKSLNNLIVAERNLKVERAQANAEIERQKLLAEDVTKTFEERATATEKAFNLENELLNRELELQRERVRIIQEQNALSESSEEDLEREAEALIRLAELEQTSLTKQIELNNKLNSIEKEREADKLKKIEEEEKRLEEEEKKEKEGLEKKKELEEERTKIVEEANKRRLDIEEATANSIVGLLQTLGNKSSEFAILAFAVQKGLAIAEVFTDLAKAKSANALAAAKIAAIAPPVTIAQGAAYLAAANATASGNAALQIATIGAQVLTAPKFADGVIGLNGEGTGTSDSNLAWLSRGESVMTAKETNDFFPTLTAIRKGYIDPDLINSVSTGGSARSGVTVVEVPGTEINMNEDGFSQHMLGKHRKISMKENRFNWKG